MTKKIYRSNTDKMMAGVLGGFAEYFEHDSTFWRLGFLIFLVLTGLFPGVLMYFVAWIIVPLRPTVEPVSSSDYSVSN